MATEPARLDFWQTIRNVSWNTAFLVVRVVTGGGAGVTFGRLVLNGDPNSGELWSSGLDRYPAGDDDLNLLNPTPQMLQKYKAWIGDDFFEPDGVHQETRIQTWFLNPALLVSPFTFTISFPDAEPLPSGDGGFSIVDIYSKHVFQQLSVVDEILDGNRVYVDGDQRDFEFVETGTDAGELVYSNSLHIWTVNFNGPNGIRVERNKNDPV